MILVEKRSRNMFNPLYHYSLSLHLQAKNTIRNRAVDFEFKFCTTSSWDQPIHSLIHPFICSSIQRSRIIQQTEITFIYSLRWMRERMIFYAGVVLDPQHEKSTKSKDLSSLIQQNHNFLLNWFNQNVNKLDEEDHNELLLDSMALLVHQQDQHWPAITSTRPVLLTSKQE